MSATLIENDLLHYEVLGRGRPIIFLHSWVGSWRYWVPTMQTISMNFRTYAIDLWGFGDSAKNQKYSLDEQVTLVNQFIEQLGIIKVAFVCHGLGALVALKFAQLNPESVDRLMAVSFPFSEKIIDNKLIHNQPASLVDWLFNRNPDFDAIRADASKNDPNVIESSIKSLDIVNYSNLWQNQTVNCLFVNSTIDPIISPPSNEIISSLNINSQLITFTQSGHFPMVDESSKFNRLLVDFLELEQGASPRQLQLKEEWKRRVR
jgi:pimeloyl-ACP methyl ester carboxylesterase